jgi:beta-glucanase (GH16 family)
MSIWTCYIDPACVADMYVSKSSTKNSDSKKENVVPFFKIVCTIVQLNTCTKEHVPAAGCRVSSETKWDVAAGRQSNNLAVRTVSDITDVQHKNRQK